jgi:hypothetical protein
MPKGAVAIKKRELERTGLALKKLGLPIARLDLEGGKASFVLGEPSKAADDLDRELADFEAADHGED